MNELNRYVYLSYLSDSGTTEEANLTTLSIGGEQIDDLDASDQDLLGLALLGEEGSGLVDGGLQAALDGALLIDGLADDVDDTAEGTGSDGNHDGGAGVVDLLASHEALSGLHGNSTNGVLTQVLGDLQHQALGASRDRHLEGVEDRGEGVVALNVDDGTDDLGDDTLLDGGGGGVGADCR